MNNNILKKLFDSLKIILNKQQKRSALNLFFIMVIGMILEILLLNNLFILLNYLSNTNLEVPEIIKYISDTTNSQNISLLVLLLFILTFFVKTVSTIIVKWKEGEFVFSLKAKISERLFIGYLNLPMIFHQRTNTARTLKNITTEVDQFSYLVNGISTLALELLVLAGISFYLILIDPIISISCIISFVAFGYFFNMFNKGKIKTMSENRLVHQDGKIKSIMEGLIGMRELKIWSKENSFLKMFSVHNNEIANISTSTTLRNNMSKPAFEIFMLILLSIFLIYFLSNDLLNASVIPMFGLYLAAAYRLVPSIAKIVQSIQNIQFNLRCAENLTEEIEKFPSSEVTEKNSKIKINFFNEIKVENLTFCYDLNKSSKQNANVLENINFEVKKGECVGIEGESGSGKSTLIDLLIGLQSPTKGKISVDGININDSIKNWQKLVGCVPQEVFIIDDTLKKNIAFGLSDTNISEEQVKKCLEFSNLKEFSDTLENKLETVIGERGARLSGGQKQRIGIARAIYHNPEILIFDESTSSLDLETEKKILKEIYSFKKKKTIFIISHKNKTLENCDYILKIKGKKLEKI
tara:strand:+ start:4629 stop:6371 length:1743 start_codon:yes stop_codon:yes gene_type:complete